ncbi:MAG: 60S ribosomal protein L31 [Candidatus Thorarchaeota archaeon]|nr:60S ribosomal protein L31 [Candidatus Thorarchaeota archaeon]
MSKKKKEVKPKVSEEEPEIEEIEEIEEVEDALADAKPPKSEAPSEVEAAEKEEEEEIIDERIYTVPLRKAYWTGSRLRRANRSVRILREFVVKHMKPEELLIQQEVNEQIWARGMQKPPRRLRIRATKNADNLVRVYLAEG